MRAFVDGRSGYAYGTDLSRGGRGRGGRAPLAAAADVADPDEYAGLPDECGATPVGGLASPALARLVDRAQGRAGARDRARGALAAGRDPGRDTPSTPTREGSVALANSRGFSAGYDATQAWAYASAFAGEGADLMTGLGVDLGRDPGALDPEAIGGEAAERALALVGARQPESRRCPVVLDAFVAASFIGFIGSMLSADAVQRGRSLFADKEGDEIADPALVLTDDATDPEGPASAPFDGEGVGQPPHAADRRRQAARPSCSTRAPPARRAAARRPTPAAAPTARRPRSAPRTWSSSRASATSRGCSARLGRAST